MKICSRCKKSKELTQFHKDKNTKDGLCYPCKDCCIAKSSLYANRNKDKVSVYQSAYREENKESLSLYRSEYGKVHYQENKEQVDAYQAVYRSENKKECNARISAWGRANPGKRNAITAKYRAKKLHATLKWLTKDQLKEIRTFYIDAAILTEETGIPHHVDHIVPLQGKNVSGLHVPWNLQILVGPGPNGNLSKGNSFPI